MTYHYSDIQTYGGGLEGACRCLNSNALYKDTYIMDKWAQTGENGDLARYGARMYAAYSVGMSYTFEYDITTVVGSSASIASYTVASTENCNYSSISIRNNRYIRFTLTPSSEGLFAIDLHTFSGSTAGSGTQYNDKFYFSATNSYYTVTFNMNGGTASSNVKTTQLRATRQLDISSSSSTTYQNYSYLFVYNFRFDPTRTSCRFVEFNSSSTGGGTSYAEAITLTGNLSMYAVWETDVQITAGAHGTVSQSTAVGIVGTTMSTTTASSQGSILIGDTRVYAYPDGDQYKFDSWTNASGIITPAHQVTANFTIKTYSIGFQAINGSVSNAGGTYPYGGNASSTATADYDYYAFEGWYKGGVFYSSNLTIEVPVDGNAIYTAKFKTLRYTTTVYNKDRYTHGGVTIALGGFRIVSYSGGTIYSNSNYTGVVPAGPTPYSQDTTFYIQLNSLDTPLHLVVVWAGSRINDYESFSATDVMYNVNKGEEGKGLDISGNASIYGVATPQFTAVIHYVDANDYEMATQSVTSTYQTINLQVYGDDRLTDKVGNFVYFSVSQWTEQGTSTTYAPYSQQSFSYGPHTLVATSWSRKRYTWTFQTSDGIFTESGTDYTSRQVPVWAGMTSSLSSDTSILTFTDTLENIYPAVVLSVRPASIQRRLPATWSGLTATVGDARTVTVTLEVNNIVMSFSVEPVVEPARVSGPERSVAPATVSPTTLTKIAGTNYSMSSASGTITFDDTSVSLTANSQFPYCRFQYWMDGNGDRYSASGIVNTGMESWEAKYAIVLPTVIYVTPSTEITILRGQSVTVTAVVGDDDKAYPNVTWQVVSGADKIVSASTVITDTAITVVAKSNLSTEEIHQVVLRATSNVNSNVYTTVTITVVASATYLLTYPFLDTFEKRDQQQAYVNQVIEGRGERLSGWANDFQVESDAINNASISTLLLNGKTYAATFDLSSLTYGSPLVLPDTISTSDISVVVYDNSCTVSSLGISGKIVSFNLTPLNVSALVSFRLELSCSVEQYSYLLYYKFFMAHTSESITVTYDKNSASASFVQGYSPTVDIPVDTREIVVSWSRDCAVHTIRPYNSVTRASYTNAYWLAESEPVREYQTVLLFSNYTYVAHWTMEFSLTVQSGENGSIYDMLNQTTGTSFVCSGVPNEAEYGVNSSGVLEIYYVHIDPNTGQPSEYIYYGRYKPEPVIGYMFTNWTITGGSSSAGSLSDGMVFTANFALQTSTFKVIYSAQGANPSTIPTTQSYTGAVTSRTFIVSQSIPVRQGLVFSHWLCSDGEIYHGGDDITVTTLDGSGATFTKTLVAVFGTGITVHFNTTNIHGEPVADVVRPSIMMSDTTNLSDFPIPVMKDGFAYNGWRLSNGTKVTTSTNLLDNTQLYVDAISVETCGATFTFARWISGELRTMTYHLPMVQAIEDKTSVNLTEISTIVYGVQNRFVMDTGTSQKYSLEAVRTTPSSWRKSIDDEQREVHDNYWSGNGSDQTFNDSIISNALWIELFKQDLDMWQNFGVDSATGAKTGGFRFIYFSGDTELYPLIDKNVFLSGVLTVKYQYGKLNLTLPLQVARMLATGSTPNMRQLTLKSSTEGGAIRIMTYPDMAHILIPAAPVEWQDEVGVKFFRKWLVEGSSPAQYMYPGDSYVVGEGGTNLTLIAIWQEPDGIYAVRGDGISVPSKGLGDAYEEDDGYLRVTNPNTTVIAYALGGGGGGGGYAIKMMYFESQKITESIVAGGGGGSGDLVSRKFLLDPEDLISWSIGGGGSAGSNYAGLGRPATPGGQGGETTISVSSKSIVLKARGGAGGSLGGTSGSGNDFPPRMSFIGGAGGRTINSGGRGGICTSEMPRLDNVVNTVENGMPGSTSLPEGMTHVGEGGSTFVTYKSGSMGGSYYAYLGGGGGAPADFHISFLSDTNETVTLSSYGGNGGYYTGANTKVLCEDGTLGGGGGSGPCGVGDYGIEVPIYVGGGGSGAVVFVFYKETYD